MARRMAAGKAGGVLTAISRSEPLRYNDGNEQGTLMIPDSLGQQLHDKATRGGSLSAEEQAALTEWYRRQDEDEGKQLRHARPPADLEALRREYHRLLGELVAITQQIQAQATENERLSRRVEELEKQLILKRSKQPA